MRIIHWISSTWVWSSSRWIRRYVWRIHSEVDPQNWNVRHNDYDIADPQNCKNCLTKKWQWSRCGWPTKLQKLLNQKMPMIMIWIWKFQKLQKWRWSRCGCPTKFQCTGQSLFTSLQFQCTSVQALTFRDLFNSNKTKDKLYNRTQFLCTFCKFK